MAIVDRKALVACLSDPARAAVQAAARRARDATHYAIELEHLLLAMLEQAGDVTRILTYLSIDHDRVTVELTQMLETLRAGCGRLPEFPPRLVTILQSAWLVASLRFHNSVIRSGHILIAVLADTALAESLHECSPALASIDPIRLSDEFAAATKNSIEEPAPVGRVEPRVAEGGALARFTTELVARARQGRIDPVLGRDGEIRQTADILMRRRQNNPILTGEPGVGKTAIVEGLAARIAAGDVPPSLRDIELRALDLGLLQAGAAMKGEFESRLKSVIDEIAASPVPIVLFIDEAHTLIGAGGQAGQNDAANLLKPALARGELRTIAATTWSEYKKYFEKDAALTRRFQVVRVEEPGEPIATAMLRGLAATLEAHHGVRIMDEALSEAVRLSARYIPARQLPDKAISLIDTACARVAMSQAATPAAIEDRRRRLGMIATERAILKREMAAGAQHAERYDALATEAARLEEERAVLDTRLQAERALVARITALRDGLDRAAGDGEVEAADSRRAALTEASLELARLQGEAPLVFPVVDGQAVAEVVHAWTGIPAGRMRSGEIRTVLGLHEAMQQRIIGQPHALAAVAQAIHTSRARLTDPRKPVGVFLMVGTSGTGKTETALTLADILYGGEQNLTIINMSEFKEEHKVSLLMGSPPGYVGYGEGGVLTEAVRRRPYSVVLLDEMEKAHPGVQDVFYQVFDKGSMKDGEGRDIDFRNTVIVMTSNAGTELIARLFAEGDTADWPDAEQLALLLAPELARHFKPAFLARVTIVPYLPLSDAVIRRIAALQLARVAARVQDAYHARLDWDLEVEDAIAARCAESAAGARNVEAILNRTLLADLSTELLGRQADGISVSRVHVSLDDRKQLCYDIV